MYICIRLYNLRMQLISNDWSALLLSGQTEKLLPFARSFTPPRELLDMCIRAYFQSCCLSSSNYCNALFSVFITVGGASDATEIWNDALRWTIKMILSSRVARSIITWSSSCSIGKFQLLRSFFSFKKMNNFYSSLSYRLLYLKLLRHM